MIACKFDLFLTNSTYELLFFCFTHRAGTYKTPLKNFFYDQYKPMFLKSIETMHLITRKRYDLIVGILLNYEELSAAKRRGEAAWYNCKCKLQGPVKSTILQRQQGGSG